MHDEMPAGVKLFIGLCVVAVCALLIGGIVWVAGSENPETPAGYVGYLTQGAVFGNTEYKGLQTGPTSYGRVWKMHVVNISVTPYTHTEEFSGKDSVLSKDNLKIEFRLHAVWRVNPEKVKEFVEKYSTLNNDAMNGGDPMHGSDKIVEIAYANFIKEPLRTFGRDEIQKFSSLEIKDNITPIGAEIFKRLIELTRDTPFEIRSVVVGNVQYPDLVANAVAEKMAATQKLEQMKTELQIEEMKKQRRVIEARGISEAMEIINQKLTPMYIQHEAVEAQKMMVGSPNHTTVYLPVGPMGVPIVGTLDLVDSKKSDSSKAPVEKDGK